MGVSLPRSQSIRAPRLQKAFARASWFLFSLSLFLVWHGFHDLMFALGLLPPPPTTMPHAIGPFGIDLAWGNIAGQKAIICFILGGTLYYSLANLVTTRAARQIEAAEVAAVDAAAADAVDAAEVKELIRLLELHAGLKRLYPSDARNPVMDQPYCADMRRHLAQTKLVKLLSIAGYEFLGRGEGSVLYEILAETSHIAVEVILLTPDNSSRDVVDARLKQLLKRDPQYRAENLRNHINETMERLRHLKRNRKGRNAGEIKLYTISHHPIFRLVVLDHALYMSAYGEERHGHESAMFRFDPVDEDSGRESLYAAYDAYFDAIRARAAQVTL